MLLVGPFFVLMLLQNVTQALFDIRLLKVVEPHDCLVVGFEGSILGGTLKVRDLETQEAFYITLPIRKGYRVYIGKREQLYIDPQFPRWSNLGGLMKDDGMIVGIWAFVAAAVSILGWRQKRMASKLESGPRK